LSEEIKKFEEEQKKFKWIPCTYGGCQKGKKVGTQYFVQYLMQSVDVLCWTIENGKWRVGYPIEKMLNIHKIQPLHIKGFGLH
jgi:hypothetical protein